MMHATDVRCVGLGILLASIALGTGCKPASTGNAQKPPPLNIGGNNETAAAKPAAADYLGTFLKSLAEGKAGPDSFTPAFRATVARPKHKNEQHESLGYNPEKIDAFLKHAAKGRYDRIEAVTGSRGVWFVSMARNAGNPGSCVIRLVAADDAAGWRVDWLQSTAISGSAMRDPALQPLQAEARIVASAFLAAMLDGQFDLAEGLMTRGYKSDLAFSTTDSNRQLGYDPVLLQNLKLRLWKENFSDFAITKQEFPDQKAAVFEAKLIDPEKGPRRTCTLTLTHDGDGNWLVNRFESK